MSNVTVPSNPADRKKLKDAIHEAANSMVRIDAEKDNIKSIRENMKDELDVKPQLFNQLVRTYHKQNYGEVTSKNEAFETLYETLFEANQE